MAGIDSNTKLMLHMNSDFSDSSDSGHSPSVSGATIDTGVKKFGAGSGDFVSGSSQRVGFASNTDFVFGTGDFTIDFQLRRDGAQIAYSGIYSSNNNPGGSWAASNDNFIISFNVNDDDRLQFRHIHLGSASALILTDASSISDATWYHIAFVRSGNTLMSFVDGVKQSDTVSVAGKTFGTTDNGIVIGRQDSNGSYYNGNIDEFRISKGTARWTETFSPPTSEYTGTAEIDITPMSLDYGNVEITTTSDLEATISNTGAGDLTVSGMTVDNNFYTIINPISVPFVVEAAGSTVSTVRFSPTGVGSEPGTFSITSDDPINSVLGLTLSGVGIVIPEINVTPAALTFGSIEITDTYDISTTIQNTGTGTLVVSGLTVDNDVYTIINPTSAPFVILSAGSVGATIRYSPVTVGNDTGSFDITSNDADEPTTYISLDGSGVDSSIPEIDVSPTSLDYGSVFVTGTSNLTTTISNLGTGILTVSGMTVDNDVYTIISPTSVPFTVPVSDSTVATIRYSPVVAGTATGNFTITSDDSDEPTVVVTLGGSGTTTAPGSGITTESTINFNLYIDQARGFTHYIDQARDFDLEL